MTSDEEVTSDNGLHDELSSSSVTRSPRYKIWQFGCNAGLRSNWQSAGIVDLEDYFSEDRLSNLMLGLGVRYIFYRVSVTGDFLRGYLVLFGAKTESVLVSFVPQLDYWPAFKTRHNLTPWVTDPLLDTGHIYMSGYKPHNM